MKLETFTESMYWSCHSKISDSQTHNIDCLKQNYKNDYLRLRNYVMNGKNPKIGENYGYLLCMFYDFTKNFQYHNGESEDTICNYLITLSKYDHRKINSYILYYLREKYPKIIVNNEEYERVNTWSTAYMSKKCNTYRHEIRRWCECHFNCSEDGIALINENGEIDIVKDTTFGDLSAKLYSDNSCRFNIYLNNNENELPEFIKFNKCYCSFRLVSNNVTDANYKTLSLRGCPKIIEGNFIADHLKLKSLIGGPEYVKGDYLVNCNLIDSLDGAPLYVGGKFNLNSNNLTDDTIKECIESPVEYNWKEVSIKNNPDIIRYRNPKNW